MDKAEEKLSKNCLACGKPYYKKFNRSVKDWKKQQSCSNKCSRQVISLRKVNQPRTCTLCKRHMEPKCFRLDGPKRSSKCIDCERVFYRAMYSIGKYRYPRNPRVRTYPKLKAHARHLLQAAVRRGKIIPQPCQTCGNPKTDGHHPDYRKPLSVLWLCRKCHMQLHRIPTNTPVNESDVIRLKSGGKA